MHKLDKSGKTKERSLLTGCQPVECFLLLFKRTSPFPVPPSSLKCVYFERAMASRKNICRFLFGVNSMKIKIKCITTTNGTQRETRGQAHMTKKKKTKSKTRKCYHKTSMREMLLKRNV